MGSLRQCGYAPYCSADRDLARQVELYQRAVLTTAGELIWCPPPLDPRGRLTIDVNPTSGALLAGTRSPDPCSVADRTIVEDEGAGEDEDRSGGQCTSRSALNMAQYENARDRIAAPYADARLGAQVSSFLSAVYGWMGAGLVITAVTAYFVASSPQLAATIATNRAVFWTLIIAQLGIVFALSARVDKLAPATASLLFIVYSALTGVTLSFILLVYTGASIASTFFVAAVMFSALAVYGTVTHRDLRGVGQFFFMGLIGIIGASIINIFWQNDGLQFVVSVIGVIVFTGLTAYDAQRLKAMALSLPSGQTGSYAVVGALALYLDFINLFLMLLRFTGQRRD